MEFLIITVGSHGDVHPFVGLARTLKARGHEVRVATNEHFFPLLHREGIEPACAIGTDAEYRMVLNDKDLFHPTRGAQAVMRWTMELVPRIYETTVNFSDSRTTVLCSSCGMGALCAVETHGRRVLSAHLAPLCVRSSLRMPTMPNGVDGNRIPTWFRKPMWWMVDNVMLGKVVQKPFNQFRADLGLKPVKSIFGEFWHSKRLTLGLWPDWFAPRQADHPASFRTSDFPLYDESTHSSLDPEIDEFLRAGDAPIAFTPGSAMVHGREFFENAIEACAQIKRRAILLTRFPEGQIPSTLPPHAKHFAYAPFSQLLPRVAALVHHGGIGTTAQALRSGTPQLIVPQSHDQPDNAMTIKKLGCGDFLFPKSFNAKSLAKKLSGIIENNDSRVKSRELSTKFVENPCVRICDAIESASL